MELIVYGIVLGSIIALGAIGLTMVFGILRFANFSHGDLMTLGAYIVLFMITGALPRLGVPENTFGPLSFGWRMVIALPVAMGATAGVAILIDRLLYRPLRRRRSSSVLMAMAALGVAFIVRSIIYIIWGADFHFYSRELRFALRLPWDIRLKPDQIVIVIIVFILVALVYLFLQHTKMGVAMRATADNMELARVTGIDTERVIIWTWGIGGALTAAGGVFYAIDAQLRPEMGWAFLIPFFAATILGGIGNPYGALVGGMVIGVAQQVSTGFFNPAYKPAVAFVILIIVLLFRPQGIFGGRE